MELFLNFGLPAGDIKFLDLRNCLNLKNQFAGSVNKNLNSLV